MQKWKFYSNIGTPEAETNTKTLPSASNCSDDAASLGIQPDECNACGLQQMAPSLLYTYQVKVKSQFRLMLPVASCPSI